MRLLAVTVLLLGTMLPVVASPPPASWQQQPAAPLYDRLCLPCHGAEGDGAGPASPWLWPKPRAFGRGEFKWRSTPVGSPPTDEDLARAIREGAPGTSMPAFGDALTEEQISSLVPVVKSFAPRHFARAATPVDVPSPPAELASLVDAGRARYVELGCVQCHGTEGRGDGPAAAALGPAAPFDLTREPLRRGRRVQDIYLTLATGVAGTGMPGFGGAVPDRDLWALTAFVDSIRTREAAPLPGAIDPRAFAKAPRVVPGFRLATQGEPPPTLTPAAAELSAQQCGRCHAKQLREWKGTLHAEAMSPGTLAQFHGAKGTMVESCQACHGPLAEQRPGLPGYDPRLRHEGITCASCHVRDHVRHGPPRRQDSALLPLPNYPLVEDTAYERSDFCLACHQLQPTNTVAGRPLLDTYREWMTGPYFARGVQCQHCHMPDREHSWKGVHDPETVRQAVRMRARATRQGTQIVVRVELENVGAGHFLPTTPTPAGWVEVSVGGKEPVRRRVGRHLRFQGGKWKELEDTRIPPGASRVFELKLTGTGPVNVRFVMHPDDYYEGFYERRLRAAKLHPRARTEYQVALERARKSRFLVTSQTLSVK